MTNGFDKRLIALISLTALLAGCASYPNRTEYLNKLQTLEPSGSSVDQFEFQQITVDDWLEFELGASDRVHDFGNGKTFYGAFEVPPVVDDSVIEIRVRFNSVAQAWAHVPLPTILLLDEHFETISMRLSDMAQIDDMMKGTEFRHEVFVDGVIRYVIVFVDPLDLDEIVPWRYQMTIVTGSATMSEDSNEEAVVGIGGPMRIRIRTPADD